MNPIEERGVTALMSVATSDLIPRADLAARSRQGGKARLRRRRGAVLGLAVGIAMAGLGATQLVTPNIDRNQTFAGPDPFGPRVEGPTRGDLSGDVDYVKAVVTAWDDSHDASQNKDRGIFDDLRGDAWVAWAGRTPAGPAALVAQKAFLHSHSNIQLDMEGLTTLLGFVGADERGRPKVVGDTYPAPGYPLTTGWFVDSSRTTVAALAEAAGVGLSTGWSYSADGRVEARYTEMTDRGGVAVQSLADGTDPSKVRIAAAPGRATDDVRLLANPPAEPLGGPDPRLPWQPSSEGEALDVLELDESGACSGVGWDQMRRAWAPVDEAAPAGHVKLASSLWFACGRLSDGRQLIVGERQVDNDPSRLVVMLRRGGSYSLMDGGPIDPQAVLPVMMRLPAALGWVVADRGAGLRHRSGLGAWSVSRRDAALLPPTATQVEVSRSGTTPTVIDLAPRR